MDAAWAAASGERHVKLAGEVQNPGHDRQLPAECLGYRGGQG